MTLTLRFAARSDRGLIREGNQDSVYAGPRLLAVADGMGGMAAGDIASNLTIAAMAPLDEDVPGDALVDALRSAVELANQNLRDAVDANPSLEGMGTTLTGMLFSGTKFGMVHVGDSRAYLLRDGEFIQVTKDDTYVQMLIDEGRITEEEASVHPQRSLLIRALQGSDVDPQYSVRPAVVGDRYLICSDGLSGPVSDDSIAATMREYVDPEQCAERLIQLALRGGGPDNITVIIADVTDEDIVEGRPFVGGAASRDRSNGGPASESTPATRASALTPRPPVDGGNDDDDEEPDPKRRPGPHRAAAGARAGDSRSRRMVRMVVHPAAVLRRCDVRRSSRGVPGRPGQGHRPAAQPRHVDQRSDARRPQLRHPEQGQAGHPGPEQVRRGAHAPGAARSGQRLPPPDLSRGDQPGRFGRPDQPSDGHADPDRFGAPVAVGQQDVPAAAALVGSGDHALGADHAGRCEPVVH